MNVARETRQRKTRRVRFVIGLSVLGMASFSVTAKQQIVGFIGAKPQAKQEAPGPARPQATFSTAQNTTFKLRRISDGTLCPMKELNCSDKDVWFKRFTLLASDGNTLYLTSIPFPSIERSKEKFESSVKEADEILRLSSELNNKGEPVGERAIGLSQETKDVSPPSVVSHYKLFWMCNAHYWEISGEHLEDVLALEERLKEQGINAVWGWR
jgi:hypothetical protein